MTGQHVWVKSTLGHGETMCKHCYITNREAAVLNVLNHCDKAEEPVVASQPVKVAEALRTKLVEALDGHTKYSRDCSLSGEFLVSQIWPLVSAALSSAPATAEGWRTMDSAPKDRLIDIWLSDGVRWCDCYYDRICDQWRTSRPSGHLLTIRASSVQFWRPPPAAPTATGGQG